MGGQFCAKEDRRIAGESGETTRIENFLGYEYEPGRTRINQS